MADCLYRYLLLCHTIPSTVVGCVSLSSFKILIVSAEGNYHGSISVQPMRPFTLASGPAMLANVSK